MSTDDWTRPARTAAECETRHADTRDLLDAADPATAERARERLHAVLAEHDTGDGVYAACRAWIVTARRG